MRAILKYRKQYNSEYPYDYQPEFDSKIISLFAKLSDQLLIIELDKETKKIDLQQAVNLKFLLKEKGLTEIRFKSGRRKVDITDKNVLEFIQNNLVDLLKNIPDNYESERPQLKRGRRDEPIKILFKNCKTEIKSLLDKGITKEFISHWLGISTDNFYKTLQRS